MNSRNFLFSYFSNTVMVLAVVLACLHQSTNAQYAVEVVSYNQGTTAAQQFNPDPAAPPSFFNLATAALGSPERITGEAAMFPGPVTVFSPTFGADEIVSVGEGGQVTLRLSNFVIPQSGGPEIGVFTNAGLINDDGFPNPNVAGTPADTFGDDIATVEVSQDGANWISLGIRMFDVPASGHTDLAATVASDFTQPFTGTLSSFDGLDEAGALAALNGSGGGNWLDISATGLPEVGYVRFSVADDGNAGIGLNFELDAVSIASSALGAATVPEPSAGTMLALAGLVMLGCCGRRRR